MPQFYTPKDIGGFGRLANIKMSMRAEDRKDRESEFRSKMQNIQLEQTKMNLAESKRRNDLRMGLGEVAKNIPEGENRFTVSYKYLMANDQEMANKYLNNQSDKIDKMHKLDPEGAIDAYNQTIGQSMGNKLEYIPKKPGKDDIVKSVDNETGKTVYLKKGPDGFEPYDVPEGLTVEELKEEVMPSDTKLEYWARQKIKTGKKVFNVRGKYANRMNALIEDRVAQINLSEDRTGEEAAFQQEDIKSIQKSIVAQEKQRGSMSSFVSNMGKQVDRLNEVASDIKDVDIRFLNKPIKWLSRKVVGDPKLSKYELYLGELQSEIGKLSSGSTGSVAELSQGAREHWEKVLDKNLSINDMLELAAEVEHAGVMRMESVDDGLADSRKRLRAVGGAPKAEKIKLKYNMETGGFE